MYTVYNIFIVVIAVSFITGNIVLLVEHKLKKRKLILQKGTIIDEEILWLRLYGNQLNMFLKLQS